MSEKQAQSHHQDRAWLLMKQDRIDLAEKELLALLALDPDHAWGHAQLAWCLGSKGELDKAITEAKIAISLAPEDALGHRNHGVILRKLGKLDEAEKTILRALDLDPCWAILFADLGLIYQDQDRFSDQLAAADRGLSLDPHSVTCAQLRALALIYMGRSEEGVKTLRGALEIDPENPRTQAIMGWALNKSNRYKDAFKHYSEALRLDPNYDFARQGTIESFKGKNPLVMPLKIYIKWSHQMKPVVTIFLCVLLFFVGALFFGFAINNPFSVPFLVLFLIVGGVFLVDCLLGNPLFDFFLMANPYWRLMFNRKEKWKSIVLSGAILGTLLCFLLSFWNPWFFGRGIAYSVCVFLLAGVWNAQPRALQWSLGAVLLVTIVLATFPVLLDTIEKLEIPEWIAKKVGPEVKGNEGQIAGGIKAIILLVTLAFVYSSRYSRPK